jgi:NAD(P)-dependent dehydrogenase (short-subunit alcohol dehydrogenase family)
VIVNDKYSLKGKTAIVTGAGGGICRAISIAFAEAGASVACVDLNLKSAQQTVGMAGGKSLAIACDVASESDTAKAVEQAVKALGAVHVLVNGAAVMDAGATVTELDLAGWNRVVSVNLGGAFLMSRWTIPHMAKAGGGSIIHIASQLGSVGSPSRVAYCATKGALINLARAMAIDHAAQKIRVNTLSPGAVETDRLLRYGSMEKAREVLGPKHLLNRLGQPEEIASAALFLASDASSFMTGSDLVVDGGFIAV